MGEHDESTVASFRGFVGQHRTTLVGQAVLLTAGDVHTAEDLVQTTLTRAFLRWESVRAQTVPLAYVRRMLTNAFLDRRRRSWFRREASTDQVPEHPHPTVDGPEPDEVQALARALRALPLRMRATVVCRYWLQLSVEETATALGCSTGTVKSQTSRALDKLRADLEPDPVLHDDHHPVPSPSTLGGHHG